MARYTGVQLTLDAGASTLFQSLNFREFRNADITRKCGEQCTVRPAELERFFRGPSIQQAINQT